MKNKIFMVALASTILLFLTSCGGDSTTNGTDSSRSAENVIDAEIGHTYQLEDKYEFDVLSYKYFFDSYSETDYLAIYLNYKNTDTNSIILSENISATLLYKDKYEYEMKPYVHTGDKNDSDFAFLGNEWEIYKLMNDNYSIEPLSNMEFNYIFELPENESIEDGESIDLSITVQNTKYEYSFEKNESNSVTYESYRTIEMNEEKYNYDDIDF